MAKIFHHNSKPMLKFTTVHGTEIITDLETGLKLFAQDFEERKKLWKLEQMLGKKPKQEQEDFGSLLEEYLPADFEEIKKQKGGDL